MNIESHEKLSSFVRVNYIHGQILSVKDFQDEQAYFLKKHRLINRCRYGWGIVFGLNVSLVRNVVRVEPGLALDCQGNEIVVPETVNFSLPESKTDQYMVIQYIEKLCNYLPIPIEPGTDSQPTRIEESYEIGYERDDPCKNHNEPGSICGFCEESHAIPLAKLSYRRSRWFVRMYSCRRHLWWIRLSAILFNSKLKI